MYNEDRPDYMIRKYISKIIKIANGQCQAGSGGPVCGLPYGCKYCNLVLDLDKRLKELKDLA